MIYFEEGSLFSMKNVGGEGESKSFHHFSVSLILSVLLQTMHCFVSVKFQPENFCSLICKSNLFIFIDYYNIRKYFCHSTSCTPFLFSLSLSSWFCFLLSCFHLGRLCFLLIV